MPVLEEKRLWQEALSNLITDPKELLVLLNLDPDLLEQAERAARIFPLKVTRSFVSRMQLSNPNDPLLKQVLPIGIELNKVSGFNQDPLAEAKVNPIPGLLHKYHGRVWVMLTSACAIHCRYCFRRYFPYEDNNPGRVGWEKIMDYIKQDENINEVILSGGDPLSVSDKLLKQFSDQLSLIPHVKRLRIHTRLPIVLPERITNEFINWVSSLKINPIIVIHANHPLEINDEVKTALLKLGDARIPLLNQSVLLKGVNDDAETLIALSEILFTTGVLPYYLHLLDKVEGAAHFDVDLATAKKLHQAMLATLPGYLVPRLAMEEAGAAAKTWL